MIISMNSNTIHLDFCDGFFSPVGELSARMLMDAVRVDSFCEVSFDTLCPRLVAMGYKLAITNYPG